jgi:uncharacterized protein (TIGR03000 family)
MTCRSGFVGIALAGALIALMADTAEAQRRARRGRGTDMGYPTYDQLPPGTTITNPDPSRQSNYPAGGIAQIQMRLPNSEAEVRFDGAETKQKGLMRLYTTPALDGTYSYKVTATWEQNGQRIARERTVSVRPGAMVMVDFTAERPGPKQ